MAWILGLDVGDKRVGSALYDSVTGLITPHATWDRAKGRAEQEVLSIVQERNIDTLVVGLPVGICGERTPQCEKTEAFCRRIEKRCSVQIRYEDEYLTSEEARDRLSSYGFSPRAQRSVGMLDAVSASIILQSYVERQKSRE